MAEILTSRNVLVGGMLTLEVREGGSRRGFQILDLMSGRKGILADLALETGPSVGKYRVNLRDLEAVGVNAIDSALKNAKVVIIDEIGPMELFSTSFQGVVLRALDSQKPVVASVHARIGSMDFGRKIISRKDVEILELTLANRERIPVELARKVASLISG